ncbi:hypothetical protein ACFVUH_19910 [Kitasatospora sp. NPDC058032]|uniref:hypothetical protein n=1 Tax=Kitasatospora sp. NPDC058032 TaxID=3346307 RepID=UPI0036DDC538
MKLLPSGSRGGQGRRRKRIAAPGALLLAVLATLVGQAGPAAAVAPPPAATASPQAGAGAAPGTDTAPGTDPSAAPSAAPTAGPTAPPPVDPKAEAAAAARELQQADPTGPCPTALAAGTVAECAVEPGKPQSFSFTLPQPQDVLFVRVLTATGSPRWTLRAPDGTTPTCEDQSGGMRRCATTQAGDYTLQVTQDYGVAGGLSVSYLPLLAPGACRTVSAADLSLAAPAVFHGSLPTGSAGECYLAADLTVGDQLRTRISAYSAARAVYDATGRQICSGTNSGDSFRLDCTTAGQAPFRFTVQAGYGSTQAYDLTLARLAGTQGCVLVEPQAYGTSPDLGQAARCRTLRITEKDRYYLAAVTSASGTALTGELFAPDGSRVYAGCSEAYTCELTPGGYTWVVDPGTPADQGFGLVLRSARETGGCTATGDTGLVSGPATGSFGASGHASCLLLPTATGTGVYLLNQPPKDTTGAVFTVLDAAGTKQCENPFSYGTTICKLTGTAPFRVLPTGAPTATYRLVVHRTGETAGCTAWPRSAFDGGWGVEVTPTEAAPQVCLGLPAGQHSTAEAVDYTNATNTGGASLKVVDPQGNVACLGSAFTCAFTDGVPYTMLLSGRYGDGYKLARRDISPTANCLAPNATTVGGRSLPLDLGSALDARCIRVPAEATDKLWLSARVAAGRYDSTVQLQVADAAGRTICVQFGDSCKVTGSTSYTMVVLAVGHKGGAPVHADVDSWRVGTANGWAPECTAHPISVAGFSLRSGMFTESSPGYCAVVDMKEWQSFNVFGATSAPTLAKPILDLVGPGKWDDYSPTYWCGNIYNAFGAKCSATGGAVAGQAVLLAAPGRAATPIEYTFQGTCERYSSTCGGQSSYVTLTSVSPATGAAGTQIQVAVRGYGLTLGSKLRLKGGVTSSQFDVTPISVNPGGTEAHVLFNTYGLQPGAYDVVLDDGSTGVSLGKAFTVTPEQAAAKGRFVPVSPSRILNTVLGVGAPAGRVGQGGVVPLQVAGAGGVPVTGATAVVMNVTAVNPTRNSAVSAYPSGQKVPDLPTVSFAAGQNVTNLVTVPLANGRVDLRNAWGEVDLGVDVVGYYTDSTTQGSLLSPVSPTRILNTVLGVGAPAGRVGWGGVVPLKVTGVAGVPTSGVTAVVMSVTAVNPTRTGFVTAYPHGESVPDASVVNFAAGQNVSNLVTVPVGADGRVDLYNAWGEIDLGVDIVGYYGASGATYSPANLVRLLDTRTGEGARIGALGGNGDLLSVRVDGVEGVPSTGVTSVLMNVTVVWPTNTSFLTVFPHGQERPDASNINYRPGEVVSTLVMVPVVDGRVSFANQWGGTDVVADLIGWFSV